MFLLKVKIVSAKCTECSCPVQSPEFRLSQFRFLDRAQSRIASATRSVSAMIPLMESQMLTTIGEVRLTPVAAVPLSSPNNGNL